MKVAVLTEFFILNKGKRVYQAGGGERRCYEICKALVKRGHEVHVYCYNHGFSPKESIIDGIHVHRLGPNIEMESYFSRTIPLTLLLKKIPDLLEANVIDVNLFLPPIISFPVAKLANKPITLSLDDIRPWNIIAGTLPLHAALTCTVLQRLGTLLDFSAVFVPTHTTKKVLLRFSPKYKGKVHVVYRGIDPEMFSSANLEVGTSKEQIVVISRIVPYKGIHHVIDVYTELREEIRDMPRLVIIGSPDYPFNYYHYVKAKALKAGCKFLGFVKDNLLVIKEIKRSLVNIVFSEFEGFGLTIIEAAACGVPTIARDIPACREVMKKLGMEELLVKDKTELKYKLMEILENREKALRLGKKAQEKVLKYFTWDAVAERMVKVWETLI